MPDLMAPSTIGLGERYGLVAAVPGAGRMMLLLARWTEEEGLP